MKTFLTRMVSIVGLVVFLSGFSSGQAVTGTPTFNSFGGSAFDTINLGNLNIHLGFPVLHKAGRGLPFDYDITYDSSVWSVVSSSGISSWQPVSGWGWQSSTDAATGYLPPPTSTTVSHSCTIDGKPIKGYKITDVYRGFVDRLGTYHYLGGLAFTYYAPGSCGTDSGPATGKALDGSGYTVTIPSGTVTSRGGAVWQVPVAVRNGAATATDANGNQIKTTDGLIFTDTLGTKALTISGGAPNSLVFTYPTTSGSAAVKLNYTQKLVCTHFQAPGINEYPPTNNYLVTSVTMPDNSSYTISYEPTPSPPTGCTNAVTGRIASIKLNTGGTISYDYQGGTSGYGGIYLDGTTAYVSRTTPDSSTPWIYQRAGANRAYTTSVVDPDGNHTVINFAEDGAGGGSFFETQRLVYQGSISSANLLLTTFNCWNNIFTNCATQAVSSPITKLDAHRQPNGISTSAISETDYNASGLVTEDKEFDYDGSTLLKDTITSYNTTLGNGIVDRPASVTVKDGSGNVKATTSYTYDEGSLSTSTATMHVGITGSRGNLTTVAAQANGSTTLYRKFRYFDTGMVYQSGDVTTSNALTNPTTYAYYAAGNCPSAYAFPATITEPLSLSRSATWDCDGGVLSSTTDENSNPTSYSYDSSWRTTDVKYPDGGETKTTYNMSSSPSNIQTQQQITTGNWISSQTNLDGLGRAVRRESTSDPNGTAYTDTTYDALGRLASVSHPYYTSGDATYGTTEYVYDALGRITMVTNDPDGTFRTLSYNGRATETTDESGIKKVYQSDGLGRLAYVCDGVGASAQANGATATGCGLDISANGFKTTYGYDALSNLTSVNLTGQSRSFTYDELSRMTGETNPESGTVTNVYDSGTAGDLYTRTAPKPNGTSGKVTTTYSWDGLHRISNISFSDGSVGYYYTYDLSTDQGHALANSKGRLVEPEHGSGTTAIGASILSYDKMGRVAQEWACQPSNCGLPMTSLAYTYNLLGEKTTATSANGAYYFTYNYNPIGQLASIVSSFHDATHPSTEYSGATYNALGELTSGTYGDNIVRNNTYNHMGRLTEIQDGPTASPTYRLYLGYAPNGSVASYNDTVGGSWSLTYDKFNRLATGSNGDTGNAYSYSYDQYGNRWQQHLTAGTGNEVDYTFNANNQNITSGFAYDAAGNLVKDGSGCNPCWTYDDSGNLISDSGGASFSYNGASRRVEKITPDGTKHDFLLDPSGKPFNEFENGNTIFSRVTGGVFTFANAVTYFNHSDHLGTPRVTTDYTGAVARVESNLPWGDNFSETGSLIDFMGWAAGDWDPENNADHFGAREYGKTQGRWLTPDPSGLAAVDMTNPQTWNRYAYAGNNPLSFVDPLGLDYSACTDGDPFCGNGGIGGGGGGGCTGFTDGAGYPGESCGGFIWFFPVSDGGGGGGGGGGGPYEGRRGSNGGGSHGSWPGNETLGLPQGLNLRPMSLAGLLGLDPSGTCDFGVCAPVGMGALDTQEIALGGTICTVQPEVCVIGLGVVTVGVVGYEGYQLYKHFSNNVAQNRQFDEAVRQIESKCGQKLDKGDRRRLHDEITGGGYSLPEIVAIGVGMFCPGN